MTKQMTTAILSAMTSARLERYAIPQFSPYSLNDTAHIRTRETVKIYAMHKDALWFTTYGGHAIEAKTIINWQKLPTQGELF